MSKIEWTEKTWNPIVGCSKVSAGCKNCYAIRMAWRLQHIHHSAEKYAGTVEKSAAGQLNWTGKVNTIEIELLKPLKWKTPAMIFVNSESDLFHESIPFEFIDKVFAVMALCPQHTFQVLTKRAARMVEYFKRRDEDMREIQEAAEIIVCTDPLLFYVTEKLKGEARKQIGPVHITSTILPHLKESGWYWDVTYTDFGKESRLAYEGQWPLKNVWLGVSVENQQAADERVPLLLQVPAAVCFLSCEPLLGPVNLMHIDADGAGHKEYCQINALTGRHTDMARPCADVNIIDWVIVGGESGKDARPMHRMWAQSLRDQCQKTGVSYFFKQWGEWVPCGQEPDFIAGNEVRKVRNLLPDGSEYRTGVIRAGDLACMKLVGKNKSGRLLDGREWNEFPVFGKGAMPDDPDICFPGFG